MCGITGFNWKDELLIKKATSTLTHRGPDDEGYYVDDNISLGHRRLSIIDLSEKGRQPMSNSDNTIFIVFNGEIYNFQDLRKELKNKYSFKSNTDTEVIIYGYEEWGYNLFNKMNGMWSFCIYDKKNNKLLLSRDRVGKKPLYYYFDGEKFIFASELKAILSHNLKLTINKEAIDFYLTTGFIPSPITIYNEIKKLEPRQALEFNLKTKKIKKWYYYNIPRYKPVYDKEKLIKEAKELLNDATRLRMISDVPVGAFLSGGLDSSSVVATMAKYTNLEKLHTFSIGFEGKYDESKYMRCVKDYLKTKHHHKYYHEKDFEAMLDKISYYYDEPFADYSNFPTYEVSKLARKYVTVALSGDGGDEIFGGYTMHKAAARLETIKKIPKPIRKILLSIFPKTRSTGLIGQIREGLKLSLLKPEEFYAELGSDIVYKPETFKKWSREKMRECLKTCNNNLREAIIRYDLHYNTLADNFLTKVDRASMANALEVRSPYLDYRFLELEAKIPAEWKTNFFKTKILMRKIIKELIPKKIVKRGKAGFWPPIPEWIKKYEKNIQEGIRELYKKQILDQEWYEFMKNKTLKKDTLTYKNLKIRLLLLIKWNKKWMKEKD